jgi:hypothetical protein
MRMPKHALHAMDSGLSMQPAFTTKLNFRKAPLALGLRPEISRVASQQRTIAKRTFANYRRRLSAAHVGVTAVRPGAAEQQKYRNGFEIDDHLSVRSPLLLTDRTSEACRSFAS